MILGRRRRSAEVPPPPVWQIDAERLRTSLNAICAALAKPFPAPAMPIVEALLHNPQRVLSSLREILDHLDGVDLDAGTLRSSLLGQPMQKEQHDRLTQLLDSLEGAWGRRIELMLGAGKSEILRRLLSRPGPSLLDIFAKGRDENAHSDVLAWLLNPRTAQTIAPPALAGLVERLEEAPRWQQAIARAVDQGDLSVRREFVIGREWTGGDELDRVDLVISGPNFVLAIENKIYSPEHAAQTETYWRWLEPMKELRGGLFLTPAGHCPDCSSFKPVSYLELLGCLLEAPLRGQLPRDEKDVLAAYTKTLGLHVLRTELRAIIRAGGST